MPRVPRALFVLCAIASVAFLLRGETPATWKMQFFHDKLDSTLIFQDIACPSAEHCVAVGAISSEKNKLHPTAVVTSDGGQHWSYVDLKDAPLSVFFLNASLGWIAGEHGVWQTTDGGAKWTQLAKLNDLEQTWFSDAKVGWAVGRGAKLYQTKDGGKTWTRVIVAGLTWPDEQVALEWIAFNGPQSGFLIGSAFPLGQLRTLRPDWLDPEKAKLHREPPSISFPAVTKDGGQNWAMGKSFAVQGTLTRVRVAPQGHPLAVLQFPEGSEWPAKIFDVDPAEGKSAIVFERKDVVAKDILALPGGVTMVAAIQPPGTSFALPIPGKLKVLRHAPGSDEWVEMPIDYRAVATNPIFGMFDESNIWVATDTGMILKLQTKAASAGLSTGLPPSHAHK